jgi:sRNA-binding regulator protein Hfq
MKTNASNSLKKHAKVKVWFENGMKIDGLVHAIIQAAVCDVTYKVQDSFLQRMLDEGVQSKV